MCYVEYDSCLVDVTTMLLFLDFQFFFATTKSQQQQQQQQQYSTDTYHIYQYCTIQIFTIKHEH